MPDICLSAEKQSKGGDVSLSLTKVSFGETIQEQGADNINTVQASTRLPTSPGLLNPVLLN